MSSMLRKNNSRLLQKNNEIRAVLGGFSLGGDARGASVPESRPKALFYGVSVLVGLIIPGGTVSRQVVQSFRTTLSRQLGMPFS